jgi:hypothetical protein
LLPHTPLSLAAILPINARWLRLPSSATPDGLSIALLLEGYIHIASYYCYITCLHIRRRHMPIGCLSIVIILPSWLLATVAVTLLHTLYFHYYYCHTYEGYYVTKRIAYMNAFNTTLLHRHVEIFHYTPLHCQPTVITYYSWL